MSHLQNAARTMLLVLLLGSPALGAPSAAKSKEQEASFKPSSSKGSAAPVKSMQKMHDEASALYAKGKFSAAFKAFANILALDPSHPEARIHAAKSLFRQKKYAAAYPYYARLDAVPLDPETTYELGFVSYRKKDYGKALEAFSRLETNQPYFDLANFYGAICAYRLNQPKKAQAMLANVMVLPNNLEKVRPVIAKRIGAKLAASASSSKTEEKSEEQSVVPAKTVAEPSVATQVRLPDVPLAPAEGSEKSAAPPPVPSPGDDGSQTFKWEAAAFLKHKNQSLQNSQFYAENKFYQLGFQGSVTAEKNVTGKQLVLALPASLGFTDYTFDNPEINLSRDPMAEIVQLTLSRFKIKGSSGLTTIRLSPALRYKLTETALVSTGLEYTTVLTDGNFDRRGAARSGTVSFFHPLGSGAASVQGSYQEFLVGADLPHHSDAQLTGAMNYPAYEGIELFGRIMVSSLSYDAPGIDGPDALQSVTTGVSFMFPLGITARLSYRYEYQQKYHLFDPIESRYAVFDESTDLATAALEAAPFKFLYVRIQISGGYNNILNISELSAENRAQIKQTFAKDIREYEALVSAQHAF
jgi:tetratricopeptide (TPR) repeat protein